MAYEIVKNGKGNFNDPDWMEFQVATVDDILTLPTSTTKPRCAITSLCLVEDGWVIYNLCSDNTWKILE